MDKTGGPYHTNGRADDTMPGAARSGPHERMNAQEVAMNVPSVLSRVERSPEMSPGWKGQGWGTDSVSPYPERVSNPHGAKHQGILRAFRYDASSVQTVEESALNGNQTGPKQTETDPNTDDRSPEVSPDLLRAVLRRTTRDENGCWLWTGGVNSAGYGQIRNGLKVAKTHQVVAAAAYGARPDGHYVCHRCDVRRCCNPDHLYYGTQKQNIDDAIRRGRFRTLGQFRRETTHCPHGHAYDESNTFWRRGGGRGCRACMKRLAAAYRRTRRAA